MNNPLNAPPSPNELVLRLIGGERDGQMFTVHNEKCLLSGLLPKTEDAERYRCAIFRGEKGVAFRSYSDHVLCNGAKVSVKWLKQGDLIKLTDGFSVEVIQLGAYTKSAPVAPAPPIATRSPTQTISLTAEQHPYENATPVKVTPVATQFISAVDSPAASASEPPKFKPATNNFRSPSVTAPLESHNLLVPQPAPITRLVAHTQEINSVDADSPVSSDTAGETVANETATFATPNEPVAAAPATIGSEIDSLTDRLSKLVDAASGAEETPAVPPQSAINESNGIESIQTETVDGGSIATPDPQPSSSDDPADRRSALESFFAKSGVSIADASPLENTEGPVSNPASPHPVPSPVDAVVNQAPAAPVIRDSVVTVDIPQAPEFDLDSVLAKLEASAAKPAPDETSSLEASNVASDVTNAVVSQPGIEDLLSSQSTPSATAAPQPSEVVESYAAPIYETPVNDVSSMQLPEVNDLKNGVEQSKDLGNNEVVTAAEDQTASTEAGQAGEDNPIKSFALLQSLGLDTTGLSDMKKEIAQSPAPEELAAIVSPIDQTEEPEPVAKPAPVESVADVLARMQSGGSLDDFSMGEAPAEPQSQPEPLSPPPVEASVSQSTDAGINDAAGDDEDGSVEDYMSQLLNRMRGEEEPTTGQVVTEKQDEAVEEIEAEKSVIETKAVEPKADLPETLTKEEFVPKQKPVRMQSLDSLREIANTSAREAFRDSIARERTISTQTKLKIALISLAFAVMFFAMSYLMQNKVNVWGVVCGVGFLVFGILTARAYLSEKKMDESIISD